MTILLRDLAGHDWGFLSGHDERLHVQSVGSAELGTIKVWLEEAGRRTFAVAEGELGSHDAHALERRVAAERQRIERLWIAAMVRRGWISAKLWGPLLLVTAYPESYDAFTREIDLRALFPGAHEGEKSWRRAPPSVDFDTSNGLLAVGTADGLDVRDHIDVSEYLFVD